MDQGLSWQASPASDCNTAGNASSAQGSPTASSASEAGACTGEAVPSSGAEVPPISELAGEAEVQAACRGQAALQSCAAAASPPAAGPAQVAPISEGKQCS